MSEFPSVEERLLNSGIPQEMAADIALEVPRSKEAFRVRFRLYGIAFLIGVALGIPLISFVYIIAFLAWGSIRPCGANFLTSAHMVALIQFHAALHGASLIVHGWLRSASHKTQMQFVAADLLRLYLGGAGTGAMRPVIIKHPECGTAKGFFNYSWRRLFVWRLGSFLVIQAAVIVLLFLIPHTC